MLRSVPVGMHYPKLLTGSRQAVLWPGSLARRMSTVINAIVGIYAVASLITFIWALARSARGGFEDNP